MSAETNRAGAQPEPRLNRVRNYGPSDSPDDRNTDDEFKRRLLTPVAAAVAVAKSPGGSQGSPAAGVSPGAQGGQGGKGDKGDKGDTGSVGPTGPVGPSGSTIDRVHKEAAGPDGAYIVLAKNHDPSETDQIPPLNPGYMSLTATASSLNDAYNKALFIVAQPWFLPTSRVTIQVLDGRWTESLDITSSQIDIVGFGRPVIVGRLHVTSSATTFNLSNFEIQSSDDLVEGVTVDAAPVVTLPYSSVQFRNVWFHGNRRAFVAYRRVYCEECWFWCDQPVDQEQEDPPTQIYASADDIDWTVFKDCRLWGYTEMYSIHGFTILGRTTAGFALKASAKPLGVYEFNLTPGLTHQGNTYLVQASSGLLLQDCQINGILLCEIWAVKHNNCDCVAGDQNTELSDPPYPGTYAIIRGHNDLADPPNKIPGRVFWDHSRVYSSFIGIFVVDASFGPNIECGNAYFRHSEHLCQFETTLGPDAFMAPFGGEANVFHDNFSSTPCASWGAFGVTSLPDSTTGTGQLPAAVYDPYSI